MEDASSSSILGGTYSPRSVDLSRYREDPLDDAIAHIVRAAAHADIGAWRQIQENLTPDDCYALFTFADRRAALALRTRDGAFADEAVKALALIATNHVDPRDLTVDFPMYALGETSRDRAGLLAFAQERSQPQMRDHFKSRASGKRSLAACELIEVQSRHGLGFMRTWWRPSPRRADLPVAAVAVADRIDEGGRYAVRSLHLSELPWVWFDRSRTGDEILTSGCVSISGDLVGAPAYNHRFLVFLADFDDPSTARAIADMARGASTENDPSTAVSHGSRVLTVIGDWKSNSGPVETGESLARIAKSLADAAFGTGPTASPHVTSRNAD
jgi:hypothetical protein